MHVTCYSEEQDCATSLHHYIVNSKMREMLISVGGDNPASCAALGLELSPDSLLLEAVNIFDEGEGAREEEAGEDVDGAYRADGDISSTDGDHVKEKPVTESEWIRVVAVLSYIGRGSFEFIQAHMHASHLCQKVTTVSEPSHALFKKHLHQLINAGMQTQNEELVCNKAGARVLSLDGGGMKGNPLSISLPVV